MSEETLLEHLYALASSHDPATCTTPGHVVIEWNGQLWCGPGGYWPCIEEGVIYLKNDPDHPLRGPLVRTSSTVDTRQS